METHLRGELVERALAMAVENRCPETVIHHSDQGSQYTSSAFGERCRKAGVRRSTGSVGDAYDNAMCESFFATLECELLDRCQFNKSGRSPARRLRLHRRLLQLAAPTLGARLRIPAGFERKRAVA